MIPSYFLFFFLMILRPPRSTLFPTRRSSDLPVCFGRIERTVSRSASSGHPTSRHCFCAGPLPPDHRSEEHTSELQSHSDLVCRLLLEKKKKKTQSHTKRQS